jgi:hypothetical protein
MTGYETLITEDPSGFAVQIVDRDTDAIVGESNDLDSIEEALGYVTRFYANR